MEKYNTLALAYTVEVPWEGTEVNKSGLIEDILSSTGYHQILFNIIFYI